MSSQVKINPGDSRDSVILGDIDYSRESNESLMELCVTLEEMHTQVYKELQKRKIQELHSFVMGMMEK